MKTRIAIGVFIFAILLASVCSCSRSPSSSPRAELTVIKKEMARDSSGNTELHVTVKNTSRNMAELAEVTVSFYDALKNLIDSPRDSVMNLGPDETWDFNIPCQGERCSDVKTYEIKTTAGTSTGAP